MTSKQQKLIANSQNKFKFFIFKLIKLPSLAFWGVKLSLFNEEEVHIQIKHGWTNQNPFGSMYFSAINGGAELSTGMHVLLQTADAPYSMLVTGAHASFTKKAKGLITFICKEGSVAKSKISALKSGESTTFDLNSIATDEGGEEVGRFVFNWSVKRK